MKTNMETIQAIQKISTHFYNDEYLEEADEFRATLNKVCDMIKENEKNQKKANKWDKLVEGIKENHEDDDFDIEDFLEEECGLNPDGTEESEEEAKAREIRELQMLKLNQNKLWGEIKMTSYKLKKMDECGELDSESESESEDEDTDEEDEKWGDKGYWMVHVNDYKEFFDKKYKNVHDAEWVELYVRSKPWDNGYMFDIKWEGDEDGEMEGINTSSGFAAKMDEWVAPYDDEDDEDFLQLSSPAKDQ